MKILVIQQKMIGDVLTSSILFEALRKKYPEAQLDYLINTHTYPVVKGNPFIDNFVFFTEKEEISKTSLFRFIKKIRSKKYDVVIDVYTKLSSNLITAFSGAKIKIGIHKKLFSFFYTNTFINQKQPKTKAGLAIENRLQLLTALDISNNKIYRPKIYLSEDEKKNGKEFLTSKNIDISSPIYMISVLGSDLSKTYPFKYMAKVVDTIAIEQPNAQILFNYIPKQKQKARAIYDLCAPKTKEHIFFDVFAKNLRDFLAITNYCTSLIGNEGGAVNMAKALDIKTFSIFSPWVKKETWNLFENEFEHVGVHLKDFNPDLFINKQTKDLKPNWKSLYSKFDFEYFKKDLEKFMAI